jgi:hypothetical protein
MMCGLAKKNPPKKKIHNFDPIFEENKKYTNICLS